MRAIKFRCWDPKENKMYFSDHGDYGRHGYDTDLEQNIWAWSPAVITWGNDKQPPHDVPNVNEFILMQFTGLKDKNGMEILEGDITDMGVVEYRTDLNWDQGGSVHPGFYFRRRGGNLEYTDGFDKCEVIGNIYENSDLIPK